MIRFTENLKKRDDIYKFMCDHAKGLFVNRGCSSQIEIEHLDGSKFDIRNCCWDECEQKIYIWSEHCGYFYFYKDDLRNMNVKTYEWKKDENKFHLKEHSVVNFHLNE